MARPKKELVDSKKKGRRDGRGRPPGDAAVMNDYRARMLASPKSRAIMTKILDAALDDDHKNQSAAWRIWAERVLPLSLFDPKRAKAASGVSIQITTAEGNTVSIGGEPTPEEEDYIDGETTDE